MKKWIFLSLALLSVNSFSKEITEKKPDANFIMAMDDFKKSAEVLEKNTDPKLEEDLILKFNRSMFCLEYFRGKVEPKEFETAEKSLSANEALGKRVIEASKKASENFGKEFISLMMTARTEPLKLCSFKIDESTPEMSLQKQEKQKASKAFNDIIDLKKTIHPVFVRMISDLEKQKMKLSVPNYRPIEMKSSNFEENFVLIYDYNVRFVEEKALQTMSHFSFSCIDNIKKVYSSQCNGKAAYKSIKGPITKYLLCADDHLKLLDKSCDYQKIFTADNS